MYLVYYEGSQLPDLLRQEVQNPGQAAPPLTDFIPKGALSSEFATLVILKYVAEDGDESDDEDDVQVGGITQDYRCPISLTIFVDPVTSYVPRSIALITLNIIPVQ